jgi:hypothetical protein
MSSTGAWAGPRETRGTLGKAVCEGRGLDELVSELSGIAGGRRIGTALVRWENRPLGTAACGLARSHGVTSTFAPDQRAAKSINGRRAATVCPRSNVLLIGSDDEVERAIVAITGLPPAALPVWPPALEPLARWLSAPPLDGHESRECVTVVIQTSRRSMRPQEQLNAWLGEHAGTLRVIATAASLSDGRTTRVPRAALLPP